MRAKKWISLMMAGAMAMSLAGCGSQETPASAETTGTVQASSEQPRQPRRQRRLQQMRI